MKTYDELKKEFNEKVKQLQAKCSHPRISDWMDEWWALGHPTGFLVKKCEICDLIVKRSKKTKENFRKG